MCGICGIFSARVSSDIGLQISGMIERARHRGPDDAGHIVGKGREVSPDGPPGDGDWALGHVRLAILDLSLAGHQPMSRDGGRIWITFNGEVYNYLELRAELLKEGHIFSSGTDTEVILAAYQSWGPECVNRFIGMFAFVIVDLNKGLVVAARDRLGVKPLYLWQDSTRTVIVSEPKQLLDVPGFRPRVNRQQIVDYLTEGLLGHEADQCCFEGVRPLPPAHTLTWVLGDQAELSHAKNYWTPSLNPRKLGWEEAVYETARLFRDCVELRLRSDVPVGSCLSGGVDSSSIVGVVCRDLGAHMNTFSVCSTDPTVDESPYINVVNEYCKTSPVKLVLEQENILGELEKVVYAQDEPFAALTIYAQWCLMRSVRRHGVPVLLDGQGGDEALCGYRKFAYFFLRQLIEQGCFWRTFRASAALTLRGDGKLMKFSQGQRYLPSWLGFLRNDIAEWLTPSWRRLARPVWSAKMKGVRTLHEHQWADFSLWSLPVLLRYEDRNSMAHGIEARLPFVDHRFVEHCLTLPEEFFFKNGRTKRLLTEAVSHAIPPAVVERRTKSHFDTSQSVLMLGTLGAFLEDKVAQSERLAAILDRKTVVQAFRRFQRQQRTFTDETLFRIATVAMWLEKFQAEI